MSSSLTEEIVLELSDEQAPVLEVVEDDIELTLLDESTEVIEVELGVGPQGPASTVPGPAGPPGPPGATSGDKNYRHQQLDPDDVWVINHQLSKRPVVQIFDSGGNEIEAATVHIDDQSLEIHFSVPYGGEAYLN